MLPAYWSLTMLWNKSISLPIVFIRIHSSLYKKLIKSTSEEEIMLTFLLNPNYQSTFKSKSTIITKTLPPKGILYLKIR